MAEFERSCAFTGHRPEKLSTPEEAVLSWLEAKIEEAVADGCTNFISGMQRGVDIWAAEIVLKLREANPGITLVAASAFMGMENGWCRDWRVRYEGIIGEADEVHYIGGSSGRGAFTKRDEWMVDNAARLIAVYDGVPGGTQRTLEYARTLGREIVEMNRETCPSRSEVMLPIKSAISYC